MRATQDYTGSFVYSPEDYALMLVRQGFTPKEYWEQARNTQPLEYVQAVLFELGQLPTTQEFYQ
jgi:hypothetical protein